MARATFGYPSRTPHQRFRREQMPARCWTERAWQFRDEEQTRFSNAFLLWNRDEALRNYDLSLAYFDTLDAAEFETALTAVLSKGRSLRSVEDLTQWEGVEGVYVMVFDGFKQLYVGQSANVRKRVRQHWTGRKSFDRLVYGTPYDSILPVDELRALDTTRLYAARSLHPDALEERLERAADPRFTLNRTAGGAFNPLAILLIGARARDHALTTVPATREEYRAARSVIRERVEVARQDATSPTGVPARRTRHGAGAWVGARCRIGRTPSGEHGVMSEGEPEQSAVPATVRGSANGHVTPGRVRANVGGNS